MKPKEIRALSADELKSKIEDLRKELFELNFHKKYGKVEKPHRFSRVRKDIARILTILKEKNSEAKA